MTEIKPGMELNRAVAEAVRPPCGSCDLGYDDNECTCFSDVRELSAFAIREAVGVHWSPSTDLNAAFEAAEKVGLFSLPFILFRDDEGWLATAGVVSGGGSTPALAVCEAILKLVDSHAQGVLNNSR